MRGSRPLSEAPPTGASRLPPQAGCHLWIPQVRLDHRWVLGDLGGRPLGDLPPVVERHHPVRDVHERVHDVLDDHDRHSAIANEPNGLEHGPDLRRIEPGQNLVEKQQVGISREGTGELEPLLLGDVERDGQLLSAAREVDQVQGLVGSPGRILQAQLAASETGTDHHVFADGELVERPDDLVGACHTQACHVVRAQATEIVAAEDDTAAVGAIDGVEDVEERRLAGPVRADESQDLAFFHAECDMGQGLETAEPLADVLDAQHHRYSRVPRRRGILARRAPISPLGMNRMMSSSTKPAIVSCSDLNGSLVSRKLRSRSYPAAPITGPRTVPKPPSMTMTIISIDVERRKASGGSML